MPNECPAVPGHTLTTPAFPPKYPTPFVEDTGKLKDALKKAVDTQIKANKRFEKAGVCIVSLEKKGAHPMAHHNGEDTRFGASMVKCAATWALHELRTTLRAIAKDIKCKGGAEEEVRFVAGEHVVAAVIANLKNLPALPQKGHKHLVPLYEKAFKGVERGGQVTIDFSSFILPQLDGMAVHSHNAESAQCIRACGYGYLNGALASAGFLEAGPGKQVKGIWLAGDYAAKTDPGKFPPYYADVTTGTSAQASSALAFAKMLTLLDDGTLFDKQADAKDSMVALMKKSAASDATFYDDDPPKPFPLTLELTKYGFSDLDGTLDVHSEASIIKHNGTGKRFVVVYQNLPGAKQGPIEFRQIATLVRDAIVGYVT